MYRRSCICRDDYVLRQNGTPTFLVSVYFQLKLKNKGHGNLIVGCNRQLDVPRYDSTLCIGDKALLGEHGGGDRATLVKSALSRFFWEPPTHLSSCGSCALATLDPTSPDPSNIFLLSLTETKRSSTSGSTGEGSLLWSRWL